MNIYQSKKNILPKLLSVFPVFIGFLLFGHGLKNDSYVLIFMGLVFFAIGLWTWFGRAYTYIDTEGRNLIHEKKWIWFSWGSLISLSQYQYIAVVVAPRGNSPSVVTPVSYDVNLVGKYQSSDHSGGFSTNVWMGRFGPDTGGHVKALSFAEDISQKTGLSVQCKIQF